MLIAAIRGYCATVHYCVDLVGRSVAYIMPALALVVAYEVLARYFLNHPTIWAYDLSLFMFAYIAALGGAHAQQRRAHINVDILYLNVSARTQSLFNLLSYSLALFFMLVIIDISWDKFIEAIEFNYRRQSEWAPHMHHFWIMSMVASGLLAAQLSSDILADLYYLLSGKRLLANDNQEEDDEH